MDNRKIERALRDLRAGRPIVVLDDSDRENEGDVVIAAEFSTPEWVNFMAREARGLICVATTAEVLDRLDIPQMVPGVSGGSSIESPFTLSVEAASGVTTGISASDRSITLKIFAGPDSSPTDVSTPGHIFPLRANPGGLRARRGHTEASVALMELAGLKPAAAICEITNEDGTMARFDDLVEFCERHDMPLIRIEDIAEAVGAGQALKTSGGNSAPVGEGQRKGAVVRVAVSTLPTDLGAFKIVAYYDARGREHVALVRGEPRGDDPVLVRLHSECLTGETFGSRRCECGDQLRASLEQIAEAGTGILIYLRQEGRGIGLVNKIRAYELQDRGMDTVEANRCLGFADDARTYGAGADMLEDLGVSNVHLLTNNPSKVEGLEKNGITVSRRLSLQPTWRNENEIYLKTKIEKMNHEIEQA